MLNTSRGIYGKTEFMGDLGSGTGLTAEDIPLCYTTAAENRPALQLKEDKTRNVHSFSSQLGCSY